MTRRVDRRTRRILRIQNQHLVQRPAPFCDQFPLLCPPRSGSGRPIAPCVPPPSPGHEDGIIEDDEPDGMVDLVGGSVESHDAVHLEHDVSAGGGGSKFGRTLDLGVQSLHLVRVEDAEVGYGRTGVASAFL